MSEESPKVEVEGEPVAPVDTRPTLEEAKASDLHPGEIEKMQKHGMIKGEKTPEQKETEKKETEKKEAEKKAADDKAKGKKSPKKKEEEEEKELSVEEEHELLKGYNKNERGLYGKQKQEVAKRQKAQIERDHTQIKLRAAEEQIALLTKGKETPPGEDKGNELETLRVAATARGKEDVMKLLNMREDDVMTVADVARYDELKVEQINKYNTAQQKEDDRITGEKGEKAVALRNKLAAQNDEAREKYEDYNKVMDFTIDLMKNAPTIFADDPRTVAKIRYMLEQWNDAVALALVKDMPYNAADIAYDIGIMHPKYNDGAGDGKPEKKPDGAGNEGPPNAEEILRLEVNASKRSSSASLNIGGRRLVTASEVTVAQAGRMSDEEFAKLPRAERERLKGKPG